MAEAQFYLCSVSAMGTLLDSTLREAVATSFSMAELLRKLGLKPAGGNYKLMWERLKRLSIDHSHWTGQAHLKGKTHSWNSKRDLSEVLVQNSTYTSTSSLRRRLIGEGVMTECCGVCGLTEWLGSPISLHLDHINGVSNDNRLENLRLLCPNCHSQTPTYCGRNINGGVRKPRRKNSARVAQSRGDRFKPGKVSVQDRP